MNYLGLKIIKDNFDSYKINKNVHIVKTKNFYPNISLLFVNHNLTYYIKIKVNNIGELFYSKRYYTRLKRFIKRLQKYGIIISKNQA